MEHTYVIDLRRIVLRPLQAMDIEPLRILRNEVKEFFLDSSKISNLQQREWYDKYRTKKDDIMFTITRKENMSEFCGAIAIYKVDSEKRTCEIGRTLVDKRKLPDRGIGQEATYGVCRFAFDTLKMEKVQTQIIKTNERSIKLHEKVGFYVLDSSHKDFYLVEVTKENLCMEF